MSGSFLWKKWEWFCNEWKEEKSKIRKEEYEEWERAKANINQSQLEENMWKTKEELPLGQVQKPGFILSWLRCIFAFLYLLSFSKCIAGTRKKQKLIRQGDFGPYRCIDIYVTVWLVAEVALAVYLANFHFRFALALGFVVLFSYRLFDIFQSWVGQFLLKSKWDAINVNRSLVLIFVGYIEIIIIGTIVRLAYQKSDALYNSVLTMIANPSGNEEWSLILYTQIMFAILFLVVVAQHVVGRLSSK